MAYSSSIKRAQAIKLCEICQDDSIKWRCIDCNMCLCGKCKTFHLRVPATTQHQIVAIGTPLQDVPKKIITDNMPCKDHPKKMTCLFCRSCVSLICPDCVSASHKKHDFVPIESVLDEKLDYLRKTENKIADTLKRCDSKTSEIGNFKSKYDAISKESITKIKQKEQELVDAIRKHSKVLQENVESERLQVNSILSKISQDVDKMKRHFQDQRAEIITTLSSNQGIIIFKANSKIKDPKFDSLPKQVEQFISETDSVTGIQELFGSLQKVTIHETHGNKIEFQVIKTYTTDLSQIDRIETVDETSAWISCPQKELCRKVSVNENTITTSKELSLDVIDMAVTSNHELLLILKGEKDVQVLKKSGEIESCFTVAPLLPNAIHITKDNNIILSIVEDSDDDDDDDDPYTLTDQSQRAVAVYDKDGHQKHIYQYHHDGKRLFTCPHRITTNNNQDILVIDDTSDDTGRVVTLNKEGHLRWVYEGHSETNNAEQFNPVGVVRTTLGHIIISDLSSHALHVLSGDGEVLTCKVMSNMGIMWPFGLDIDTEGRLWLGSGTVEDEDFGAKMHIIKMTF